MNAIWFFRAVIAGVGAAIPAALVGGVGAVLILAGHYLWGVIKLMGEGPHVIVTTGSIMLTRWVQQTLALAPKILAVGICLGALAGFVEGFTRVWARRERPRGDLWR